MIYVDEPKRYNTTLRFKVWSHMWSDECDQELHEMADKIGLSRGWFQSVSDKATDTIKRMRNHYDVTPRLRALAIHYGAQPIDTKEYMEMLLEQNNFVSIAWSKAKGWEGIHEREEVALDYYGDPDRYGHS